MIYDHAFSPLPVLQFLDDNGRPLVGGFLCTFASGTNTPLPTTDYDGKENPVEMALNSRGETPVSVLLDVSKSYKFRLLRPDRSMVWERDGIRSSGIVFGDSQVSSLSAESPITLKASGTELLIGFDSSGMDDKFEALRGSVAKESEERKAADETLTGSLMAESEERKASDKAEADERKAADETLRVSIDEQSGIVANLGADVAGLKRDLGQEIESLRQSDSDLSVQIAAEAVERQIADENILNSVVQQVHADWAETDPTKKSFIENKIAAISDAEIEALED